MKDIDPSFIEALKRGIEKAQSHLLSLQNPEEGYWMGRLEADTTLTSEYIMLMHFLDKVNEVKEAKMVDYLRSMQQEDGGWYIFKGGPSNVSATVKAYFALKLAGISAHEPFMRRARDLVLSKGGVVKANVFTKIALATFGQFDWQGIPSMPVEVILLPSSSPVSLYQVSYWSRTVIVPLLIIMSRRPCCQVPKSARIDELYLGSKEQTHLSFTKDSTLLSWRNFFIFLDSTIKFLEKKPIKTLRNIAEKKAEAWILERIKRDGGLGAIYPAMVNCIVALKCLGYGDDSPLFIKALEELEALIYEENKQISLQPCFSPTWDTALSCKALLESGLDEGHPALQKAVKWFIKKQVRTHGDWRIKNPKAKPGGWHFQFHNEFYPDTDDTAVVLMVLRKIRSLDGARKADAIHRGYNWVMSMQCDDGGWGSYDRNNNLMLLNSIPFADHGALLDPSTSDLTGRLVEMMGDYGHDVKHRAAKKAINFLKEQQEADGSWFGRWGVNYIYGTSTVLMGLQAIGEDPSQPYIRKAAQWLMSKQNRDGGWGESCLSYEDDSYRGVGNSTPSQTAWALLGLIAAGQAKNPQAFSGAHYLLNSQRPDGSWQEEEFTGTGFPKVFYLKYHMYRLYFPLMALAKFLKENTD